MAVYCTVGYCACGQEVWVEYIRKESSWCARFLNSDSEEITRCPECQKELLEDELESL